MRFRDRFVKRWLGREGRKDDGEDAWVDGPDRVNERVDLNDPSSRKNKDWRGQYNRENRSRSLDKVGRDIELRQNIAGTDEPLFSVLFALPTRCWRSERRNTWILRAWRFRLWTDRNEKYQWCWYFLLYSKSYISPATDKSSKKTRNAAWEKENEKPQAEELTLNPNATKQDTERTLDTGRFSHWSIPDEGRAVMTDI